MTVGFCSKKSVWDVLVKVLGSPYPGPAFQLKKILEDESGRIGVTGAIIAQAAFTALNLPSIADIHWSGRALCIFSLVSSILAVYFAGSQVWIVGGLMEEHEIRNWIRGGEEETDEVLERIFSDNDATGPTASPQSVLRTLVPAVSSVLTVSAPRLLLSASLKSLLTGLGVYLGFVWTKKLDVFGTVEGNRDVFVVYIAALMLCYGVYTLAGLDQEKATSATVRHTIATNLDKCLDAYAYNQSRPKGDEKGKGKMQKEDRYWESESQNSEVDEQDLSSPQKLQRVRKDIERVRAEQELVEAEDELELRKEKLRLTRAAREENEVDKERRVEDERQRLIYEYELKKEQRIREMEEERKRIIAEYEMEKEKRAQEEDFIRKYRASSAHQEPEEKDRRSSRESKAPSSDDGPVVEEVE